MNLSRCEKGHFFDKEKFAVCPHCAKGAVTDESMTSVFTEDLNIGVGPTEPLDSHAGDMGISQINPIPSNIPGGEVMPTPETVGPTAPNANFGNLPPVVGSVDEIEDTDHTVAFYDDLFAPVESQQPAASPLPQMNVSRVTTPVVGWLIVTKGMHIGQDFRLKTGKNFIGRDSQMDVVLEGDKSVSRNRHAIVVYEPKQHMYLVQPGDSSALVYLNDAVVLSPMMLSAYDVITVGEVNLLFIPLCGEKFNWTDQLKKK